MSADRLLLHQAIERWPDQTFSSLGGRMAHALANRFGPSLLCESVCGFYGFAPSAALDLSSVTLVCLKCTALLSREESPA